MPHRHFKPAARHPVDPRASFILILALASGLPYIVNKTAPQSVESQLPGWAVILWGVCLALGSAVTLVGMYKDDVDGALIEQVGSVMVGCASTIYGVAVMGFLGSASLLAAAYILGFGLACLWRWGQLQSYVWHIQNAVTMQRSVDEAVETLNDLAPKHPHRGGTPGEEGSQ